MNRREFQIVLTSPYQDPQTFQFTKDQVVIDEDTANYIADLLDAETPAKRADELQKLAALRASYGPRWRAGAT